MLKPGLGGAHPDEARRRRDAAHLNFRYLTTAFIMAAALFCAAVTLFLDRSPLKALIVAIWVPALIWVVKYAFVFYLPRGPFGF